jgi:hypothetical protein
MRQVTSGGATMQSREHRPSDTPREVCRAVILIVRPSALIKVDYPRAIDRCIDFFAESRGGRAPRMIYGAMGGRAPRPDAFRTEGGKEPWVDHGEIVGLIPRRGRSQRLAPRDVGNPPRPSAMITSLRS